MENETQLRDRLTKLKMIPLTSSFIMTERWMVKGTEVLQLTNRAQKRKLSLTITQHIELTITQFPGLFRFNPTHKLSRNSMKKPQRKTRAHNIFTTRPVLAYSARTCSLPYLVALALIW